LDEPAVPRPHFNSVGCKKAKDTILNFLRKASMSPSTNRCRPDPGVLFDQETRAGLEKSTYQIELYGEYLGTTLFPVETSERYIPNYRGRKPDLIIDVATVPIKFMVGSHKRFFPDTPILFVEASKSSRTIRRFTPLLPVLG
jgi:hypothetical protein